MPLITAAEVADALAEKLKAAGYDINMETATAADILTMLQDAEIVKPERGRGEAS
jgi:hypothetical protein